MVSLGYNYKITEFQCALGLSQLKKLNIFIKKRQKIANLYIKKFKKLGVLFQESTNPKNYYSAYHYFIIYFKKPISAHVQKNFLFYLTRKGIYLGKQYMPIHKHSFYKRLIKENFPNSEKYFSQAFQLPINPNLSLKEIDNISNNVINAIKKFKLS